MARPWTRLEHSLLLLDGYLHPRFGARNLVELAEDVKNVPEGYDVTGRSYVAQRLLLLPSLTLPRADLEGYDDNIKRHLDTINRSRPAVEQVTLKYFQQLALLYTEHVLHRFFLDRAAFLADVNAVAAQWNQNVRAEADRFPSVSPNDLTKLAYWMATGSGKTLLLHINYHQFLHYHALAGGKALDSILLITPNAGLSEQHLEEFAKSGIPAQRFRGVNGSLDRHVVQVLEITKLTERGAGPLTVHVESFEGNNLVFVDEGHRGASGDVWMRLRDTVAAEGFTFEYSATFGEAFNGGSKPADFALRQSYGKSIVFDYRYKYFHGDGYGKDYNLLNLPRGYDPSYGDVLLMGNLLAFYEQRRLYAEMGDALRPYRIEPPLLVFIGHTVQTGKSKSDLTASDKASLSDVLNMVRFLQRVATNAGGWAVAAIERILAGRSDLKDDSGKDVFTDKLLTLKHLPLPAEAIYADLLEQVFHAAAPAGLHLANLRNAPGEIGVRAGNSDTYFAVINIGDDANFLKMAEEAGLGLAIESEAIRGSLFSVINATSSPINLLIGAKKFTEGWNSWRVSGMGLLNVGRSEGSEIIQMFGRGVRLKGRDFSLKRSGELSGTHPARIGMLETLNIFSINGDYLAEFKKMLEREGIIKSYEEIALPVQYTLFDAEQPTLYTLHLKRDLSFDQQPAFTAEAVEHKDIKPVIDLRPRVQAVSSRRNEATVLLDNQPLYLDEILPLDLLDWEAIYAEMLAWKRQRGLANLLIERAVLRQVLVERRYELYAPPVLLQPAGFADLVRFQQTALVILKSYAERYYNWQRKRWEGKNLEYRRLDHSDDNLRPTILADGRAGYLVKVNRDKPELVEAVRALIEEGSRLYQQDLTELPNVYFDRHLYQPLLAAGVYSGDAFTLSPDIKTVPVALNRGEVAFPRKLREFLRANPAYLGQQRLYLLRNLSRGKGIGFFEADNFYPDFILWLTDGVRQRIVFVDPKGLAMLKPNNFDHPKIQLYQTLQEIATSQDDSNVTLDSYIISDKPYTKTKPAFGTLEHTRNEFHQHHVVFPEDSLGLILS